MSYKYGIDFGTTNSSIAFRFADESESEHTWVVDVQDTYPRETMPSLIYVNEEGLIKVGAEAQQIYRKNTSSSTKQKLIRKIKMDLEEQGTSLKYKVGAKEFSGVNLIAQIFKALKNKADICADKADIDIHGVVMGVPVQYGDIQKNVIKKALVEAGFYKDLTEADRETEFVSEPIAVAVHYGLDLKQNKNILVFDFGGGTLDVAIINLKEQINANKLHPHETIAKDRLTLGGEELTRLFFINSFCNRGKYGTREISNAFKLNSGLAPDEIWDAIADSSIGAEFIAEIEKCKCELSRQKQCEFSFIGPNDIYLDKCRFYREDFENAIGPVLDKIEDFLDNLIDSCVEDGKLDDEYSIDFAIVAGGSSLIPCIQDILCDRFGRNHVMSRAVSNDETIARLKRRNISESEVLTSIVRGLAAVGCRTNDVVEDVVDNDYGVWDDKANDFISIIKKGTKVKDTAIDKITLSGTYETVQCTDITAHTVEVKVYQNNNQGVSKLGTILICNPGGCEYRIYMQVDPQKGSLEVMFYDCVCSCWKDEIQFDERKYELK